MNLTISPQMRIVALVGLLAIVALGGSTMLMNRSPGSTATQDPVRVQHITKGQKAASVKTSTQSKTTPHPARRAHPPAVATYASPSLPATTSHASTKTAAKPAAPKRQGNLVYADLPAPLQWQLAQHKVVVVSLYNPDANVDAISVAEAHAGALDAGAGFLLVSVLDDKVAGILTALLPGGGLLPAPGILVYRAPGNIALRIDGFADRTSVAQAAQNALAGETGPTPTSTTAAVTPATVTPQTP